LHAHIHTELQCGNLRMKFIIVELFSLSTLQKSNVSLVTTRQTGSLQLVNTGKIFSQKLFHSVINLWWSKEGTWINDLQIYTYN